MRKKDLIKMLPEKRKRIKHFDYFDTKVREWNEGVETYNALLDHIKKIINELNPLTELERFIVEMPPLDKESSKIIRKYYRQFKKENK